ncbi:orotidine 5'-phosphate decarboxylase / HUMPS family protein [Oligoflexus tunisiensis]|uniref:orotidine 5'-phosphate decarboxylase / HUMPS family protein n=1 Tax=Oligoflexus tunisiensis TaxID=708132 RepID=UPI000AAC0116|nr:orotidine 5'-phosphate decarboxylase / HUMPS family protein [Oligoflexus tunisiensis]
MDFRQKWLAAVQRKNSLLCVGIDPAEAAQRHGKQMPDGVNKTDWTLSIIDAVAPYTAAIKLNRNYFKDISRDAMRSLNDRIHAQGMVSIDDSKLADIGDTNDAGIYHAKQEGFDAITYAPFPGNTLQAGAQAKAHGLGLIPLVLMSNPEYQLMKSALIQGEPLYRFLAKQAAEAQAAGIVIGAPSSGNHITIEEISEVARILPEALVLVPGIGAQGGDIAPILRIFGQRTIANVGRAIIYAQDPAQEAKTYRDMLAQARG